MCLVRKVGGYQCVILEESLICNVQPELSTESSTVEVGQQTGPSG